MAMATVAILNTEPLEGAAGDLVQAGRTRLMFDARTTSGSEADASTAAHVEHDARRTCAL
jgi:hypothetical protein